MDLPVLEVLEVSSLRDLKTELLGVPVAEGERELKGLARELDESLGGTLSQALTEDFKGKKGEVYLIPFLKGISAKRVALLGTGKLDGCDASRIASGSLARKALEIRVRDFSLYLPPDLAFSSCIEASLIASGMALYSYEEYKRAKAEEKPEKVIVAVDSLKGNAEAIKSSARSILKGIYLARDVANAPPSEMNPEGVERVARKLAEGEGLKLKVIKGEELEKLGMGGILGVGRGSSVPPRLIVLEYECEGKKAGRVAIVGKGVTFDSGGLDLKPAQSMKDMKYDKSGAAAVLGILKAASELRLGVDIVGLIPLVENLPSGNAYKPTDVIRIYDGTTVEIGDTDAEGRLILADALAYAVKNYEPELVIDLATLTGAMVIALGNHATGYFTNKEELSHLVEKAAKESGEKVWRFPLWEEYYEQLKSEVADLCNVGGREGGAITAAAFLSKFVGEVPWIHFDIAGTAWVQEKGPKAPYYPKGATGIGVYTVLKLLKSFSEGRLKEGSRSGTSDPRS